MAVLLGDDFGSAAGAAEAARRAEAQALAALLLAMHGEERDRWTVQDREPGGGTRRRGVARPRWGDVAILFRATTGLETYEQAFREAGVPYRVDGGKAYFARREVDDALLCLRAVDDPSDGPAVYGALHSTFFGFSDDELFLFWAAGGRFDLFAAQPEAHAAVGAALATLRGLHERRAESEPHELAAELVRLARAAEFLAATGSGGAQAIANLEKLVDRARAFSGAGGSGLGAFLAWAAEAGDAAGEQESQVDDDGDVVHLLTIHKAKGLEYPIVILVGGALGGGGGGGEPIVDREAATARDQAQGRAARRAGARPRAAALHRAQAAREAHGGERGPPAAVRGGDACSRPAGRLAASGTCATRTGLRRPCCWVPSSTRCRRRRHRGRVRRGRTAGAAGASARGGRRAGRRAGRARPRRRQECVAGPARRTARARAPGCAGHQPERARARRRGGPRRRPRRPGRPGEGAGAGLGRPPHHGAVRPRRRGVGRAAATAVAAELERPDLARRGGRAGRRVLALGAGAGGRGRRSRRRLPRAPHRGARRRRRGQRRDRPRLPRRRRMGRRRLQDRPRRRARRAARERYQPQGAAYALAVEAATGGVVREVCFVAARADGLVVRVPVDDELRERARGEVGAAAAAGRAVRPDELGGHPA